MKITEEELQEIIERASAEGAKAAIKEARKQKMYREGMDTYQKTEYILRNYSAFKKAISEREEQIQDIESYGIKKKSCSVTSYPGGTRTVADDMEKAEQQILALRQQNELTKRLISEVDDVLNELKSEPYYDVIPKYYFERKKYEVIAGEMGISIASVSIARKNLLEKIRIQIFADGVIAELLGV